MNINFVTVANELMASYRYHNLIPAKELEKLGHETSITNYPGIDADVCCFSKHFNFGDYFYLRGCKSKGIKTVFHVCDNHFTEKGDVENHYRRMIEEADKIIASTEEMASIIKIETGKDAIVIYDPYEYDEKEAAYNPNGPLKLLWFGHPSNINALLRIWPELKDCHVMIITAAEIHGKIKVDGKPFPIVPWSQENLLMALDQCDAVIIPSELGERQKVKSPNRLIESMRRGKYVLADEIPSYLAFDKWAWIGDIPKGLDFLRMQDKETITGRISQAQEYIKAVHSPEVIGKQWEKVFEKAVD